MIIIDTRGQSCPAPLIATKRALNEAKEGDSFQIQTDNQTSFENMSRFLKDNRTVFSTEKYGNLWIITVTKSISDVISANNEEYCTKDIPHFTKGDFVILFTSDKLGEGDEDLGHLLAINFIRAVKDLEKLPSKMIFYNRGIFLGAEGSEAADQLKEIEKMGVTLLFCETCIKHYSLGEKIKTGVRSNMFEIARVMASAGSVIKP
jgi:selenium metabolism protein YedF